MKHQFESEEVAEGPWQREQGEPKSRNKKDTDLSRKRTEAPAGEEETRRRMVAGWNPDCLTLN